jgi:hypothetical protein
MQALLFLSQTDLRCEIDPSPGGEVLHACTPEPYETLDPS